MKYNLTLAAAIGVASQIIGMTGCVFGAENADTSVSFLQLLAFGWQINLFLLALLIAAIVLTIKLWRATRIARVLPENLERQLFDDLANYDGDRAQATAENSASAFGQIASVGLKLRRNSSERIASAMSGVGKRLLGRIRRQTNYLAQIGAVSPMLGLLGTALGLLKAFNAMNIDGTEISRAALITAAIGEAMGTTICGLAVGALATAAYYWSRSRCNNVGEELEIAAENLAMAIAELSSTVAAPSVTIVSPAN